MDFFRIYARMIYSEGVWTGVAGGLAMYQIGDWVVYGIHGVCRIIGTEKQLVNRKRTQFFVLSPLSNAESRFFLPVDNPAALAKLKAVISREELTALLASDSARQYVWIQEENRRRQHYRDLLNSGDRIGLMQMISSLYRYKEEQLASGRKFHQSDDNFLRDAEKLLASEIALVMQLPQDEARAYLRLQLKCE